MKKFYLYNMITCIVLSLLTLVFCIVSLTTDRLVYGIIFNALIFVTVASTVPLQYYNIKRSFSKDNSKKFDRIFCILLVLCSLAIFALAITDIVFLLI